MCLPCDVCVCVCVQMCVCVRQRGGERSVGDQIWKTIITKPQKNIWCFSSATDTCVKIDLYCAVRLG